MLNKTYTVQRESIQEALNYITELEEQLQRFKEKHTNCVYKLNLKKNESQWQVEITISNEKEYNTQTSRTFTGAR